MQTLNSFNNEKEVKIMVSSRRSIKYMILIIPIISLMLICPSSVQTSAEVPSADYKVPIYKILIPENTQHDIWRLCEKNNLSYELVSAIFQIDGDNNAQIDDMNAEIEELAYNGSYDNDNYIRKVTAYKYYPGQNAGLTKMSLG